MAEPSDALLHPKQGEGKDAISQEDISSAIHRMEKHLEDIKHRQSTIKDIVASLSNLAETDLLDPARDYRVLTREAAESTLNIAGRLVSANSKNAVLDNSHRGWNAAQASHWAHQLHQEFDLLEERGMAYHGNGTWAPSEGDYHSVIGSLDELHNGMITKQQADEVGDLESFIDARRFADALRSQVVSEEVFPKLVTRIHKDLSVAHTSKLSGSPSTRKKTALKWDKALSDIEGAKARFDSYPGWVLEEGQDLKVFEDRVEKLHAVLSEPLEKESQLEQCNSLFNDPRPNVSNAIFKGARLGDLGELLDNRSRRVENALLLNRLDSSDAAKNVAEQTSEGVVRTTLGEEDESAAQRDIFSFGAPSNLLTNAQAYDKLSRALGMMVDGFTYEPETTHFRPSIAQSYMRSLVSLRDQVHGKFDSFLIENSEGEFKENTPREELVKAFDHKRNSMTGSADARKAAPKVDTMVENLVHDLHSKIQTAQIGYEAIHTQQGTKQSLVNHYRALSDLSAANALVKEYYPTEVATTKKQKSRQLHERQLDMEKSKATLDLAWEEATRTHDEAQTEGALEHAVSRVTLEDVTEEVEDVPKEVRSKIPDNATAAPWKSSFNWAEDEDEADLTWWLVGESQFRQKTRRLRGETTTPTGSSFAGDDQEGSDPSVTDLSSATGTGGNAWFRPGGLPASKRLFQGLGRSR
ncbi:hypothetical protein L198_04925 [Cryptococcus wingfieldii CBS 7118]|uniref:Uncharacterized protein n=1 Tax=Cryptococcus wingfieldii CBS 7118 TaxID=1295528 RepID=A0A1E3J495_9TREE|nr:hypothetical protein L198_04925 [Cryptococcus wingfieldii CBS 7118]ODN94781.1 hypothetical protein L198_04925 [Cryptococcus wingfieldii CBS 7118]